MTQMRWLELLSTVRIGSKKQSTELARSPFHKDYDRIIFSQSFRQLNRKTQVHPLTQHDGIHTRLTHSLEVSCIGRSLGMLAAEKSEIIYLPGFLRLMSVPSFRLPVWHMILATRLLVMPVNTPFGNGLTMLLIPTF